MGKHQDAWHERNKEYVRAFHKAWRMRNKDLVAHYSFVSRLKQYGLTENQFNRMWNKQKGRCAICNDRMDPPCIDHDHETGVTRKLLCKFCNWGLGQFKDDPRRLAYAMVYLEEHGKRWSHEDTEPQGGI